MPEARKHGLSVNLNKDRLYINGSMYTTDTLRRLSYTPKPEHLATKIDEKYILEGTLSIVQLFLKRKLDL